MNIFVAGGTGTIGQSLIPKLVKAGNKVTALSRSEDKFDKLRTMGATPVIGDILNKDSLTKAMVAAKPDIVLHQVTALSSTEDPFGQTNQLRKEGTANLIHAAREAKANRFIAQSVAFFCDPTVSNEPETNEETPLYFNREGAPSAIQSVVGALASLEKQVLDLTDMEGIVLRYGHFYGPQTFYGSDGWVTSLMKGGQYPIIQGGKGTYSFITVDDAAAATVQAVSQGKPGIYTIVDDSPVSLEDWVTKYAKFLKVSPPEQLSEGTDKIDPFTVFFMTLQKGASNEKAKAELDWCPQTPVWSDGFGSFLSSDSSS